MKIECDGSFPATPKDGRNLPYRKHEKVVSPGVNRAGVATCVIYAAVILPYDSAELERES